MIKVYLLTPPVVSLASSLVYTNKEASSCDVSGQLRALNSSIQTEFRLVLTNISMFQCSSFTVNENANCKLEHVKYLKPLFLCGGRGSCPQFNYMYTECPPLPYNVNMLPIMTTGTNLHPLFYCGVVLLALFRAAT